MTTARSEKQDKQLWHRRFRRQNRQRVHQGNEPWLVHECSDPWGMDKDGKQCFDATRFPWLMRK